MLADANPLDVLPDDLVRSLFNVPKGPLITVRKDITPEPERPIWQIACNHWRDKYLPIYTGSIDEMPYTIVALRPTVLHFNYANGFTNHMIYIGRCPKCGTCYWCNT